MNSGAGYSGKPLVDKLGIKKGCRLKTKNAPADYRSLLAPLPDGAKISSRLRAPVDVWHVFSKSRRDLARVLPTCIAEIQPAGTIWVSWPKKASRVRSSVTEDVVRELALPLGLVDIKVCAVDETWSALKLVLRRENRP